jgi:transposase
MEVLHPCCAGLDVHQKTVVACVRRAHGAQVQSETRTFSTSMRGLLALAAWLDEHSVTHAVMESTGVYWKPVWHVLDDGERKLTLANARDVKNLPGRKTDVNDAQWLADLLAHGLVRPSFVAPQPVQELRDLTRARKQLIRERAQHIQRVQKTLENANLKLTGTLSDVMGKSGRGILNAIVAGESDPEVLASLAVGKARKKHARLVEVLQGRVREHHRGMLRLHLKMIDALSATILEVDGQLGNALAPSKALMTILMTMPGISEVTAQVILAEIGDDMSRFPTAGHLLSWAGLCPRNDESAGRKRDRRIRKGSPWLRATLVQAAWAAAHSKGTYLRALFLRLQRKGAKKATIAVAASMLTAVWHMLRNGVEYEDLGADHFTRRDEKKVVGRLTRRIEAMGYEVELKKKAA